MMNFWKGKSVLVTGAGGFIGSKLCYALRLAGADVVALCSRMDQQAANLFSEGCVVEWGSILDPDRMRSLLSLHEVEYVFHLAAYSIVRLAARDPVSTYQTNVMGTVNLLEACRSYGSVKKIVCASSDKAYGDHEELPYTEEHPLQPLNTYDVSKACMDMISRSYAHNYGMPVVVTRCSNVYGPGDRNWSRLIPNTIRRVLDGKPPMVYSDVASMCREFIYIDDVVTAYLGLGVSGKETDGQAYNIGGTAGPVSVSEVIQWILHVMDRSDLKMEVVPREPTFREIQKQFISAEKLLKVIGWYPQVRIVEGLKETVDWVRENP